MIDIFFTGRYAREITPSRIGNSPNVPPLANPFFYHQLQLVIRDFPGALGTQHSSFYTPVFLDKMFLSQPENATPRVKAVDLLALQKERFCRLGTFQFLDWTVVVSTTLSDEDLKSCLINHTSRISFRPYRLSPSFL